MLLHRKLTVVERTIERAARLLPVAVFGPGCRGLPRRHGDDRIAISVVASLVAATPPRHN